MNNTEEYNELNGYADKVREALFNNLNDICRQLYGVEFNFVDAPGGARKKESRIALDGQKHAKKNDRTFCKYTPGEFLSIGQNGGSVRASGDLIKVFGINNGLRYSDALKKLGEMYNVPGFPERQLTPEQLERIEKAQASKTARALAGEVFALNLEQAPETDEAKTYLLTRFTPEELKVATEKHLLGLADAATLARLEEQAGGWHSGQLSPAIGTTHKIAVISTLDGEPYNFNFRALPKDEASVERKYLKPSGSKFDFFGGLSRYRGIDSAVLVEGEIDRIKATVSLDVKNREQIKKGLKDFRKAVVSVGTNNASEEQIKTAIASGIKTFYIIPDSDSPKEVVDPTTGKKRQQFTNELPGVLGAQNTARKLYEAGAQEVYICELPASPNGEKVDTADYISKNGVISWLKIVEECPRRASAFLALNSVKNFCEEAKHKGGAPKHEADRLAKELRKSLKLSGELESVARSEFLEEFDSWKKVSEESYFFPYTAEALKEALENSASKSDEERFTKQLEDASAAAKKGDYARALELAKKASASKAQGDYSDFFRPPTFDEVEKEVHEIKPGVSTGMYVLSSENKVDEITLKEGVSLVVGARKHGKTTFLLNVCLREAEKNIKAHKADEAEPLKKVVLYTYEVRKKRLYPDLLAMYLYKMYKDGTPYSLEPGIFEKYGIKDRSTEREISDEVISLLNKNNVARLYQEGENAKFFDEVMGETAAKFDEARALFSYAKRKFISEFIETGALTIIEFFVTKDVEDVTASFAQFQGGKYYGGGVSLLAIDYIQKLSTSNTDYKGKRTEELKYIGEVLTGFAMKNNLPVLAAAQFNRISSLLDVDTNNIGEAGDLERNAVDVIGLFNLKELKPVPKSDTLSFQVLPKKLRKFGIPDTDFLFWEKDKSGEEKGMNFQPVAGKLYINLMASRYSDFPAENIVEMYGANGFIDFKGSSTKATDASNGIALSKATERENEEREKRKKAANSQAQTTSAQATSAQATSAQTEGVPF